MTRSTQKSIYFPIDTLVTYHLIKTKTFFKYIVDQAIGLLIVWLAFRNQKNEKKLI